MNGILEDIVVLKKVNTKFGEKPIWGIISGGRQYEVGFKKPTLSIGSEIEFETERKYGSERVVEGSLRPAGTPFGPSPAPGSTPLKTGITREESICRQNALTNARELFVGTGPIHFGLDSKYDRDQMVQAIIEVAVAFEFYTTGKEK